MEGIAVSKANDAFRAKGVYNPHDLVHRYATATGNVGVYLAYQPQDTVFATGQPGWYVLRPGYSTDPKAAWYHHGNKFFSNFFSGHDRERSLNAAKQWASERYDVKQWVKIPGLTWAWFPQEIAEFAKALVKS